MGERPAAAFLILALTAALPSACGRKGPIQPPLVLVPQRVESLQTWQQGGRVLLDWPASTAFVDGRALPPGALTEIWLLPNSAAEAAVPRDEAVAGFLDKAKRIAVLDAWGREVPGPGMALLPPPPDTPPPVQFHWERVLTPEEWSVSRLIFGVRVIAGKRSASGFTYMGWWPRRIPAPPAGLRGTAHDDRIELRWTPPDVNMDGSAPPAVKGFNVYRTGPDGVPVRLNHSPVAAPFFMDRTFAFGADVTYRVRALTGDAPFVESDDSEPFAIRPEDTFPPTPPGGLTAVSAPGLITLIWEPSVESDVAGYRVWRRAEGEGGFRPLTDDLLVENTLTDTSVEKGRRYEYAVSAIDRRGNESPRSVSIAETIKEPET